MINELFNGIYRILGMLDSTGVKSLNNITFSLDSPHMERAAEMSIVGIVIVFVALIITAFAVYASAKIIKRMQMSKVQPSKKVTEKVNTDEDITGEINAAISMALHLYFAQIHDEESAVLTIQRVPRPYAPWSSKIYNIRKLV